jgi:hypothetical protein
MTSAFDFSAAFAPVPARKPGKTAREATWLGAGIDADEVSKGMLGEAAAPKTGKFIETREVARP